MVVLELLFVVVLFCVAEDEFVDVVLVVKVRPSIIFPTSNADFRCLSFGLDPSPAIEDFGLSYGTGLGGTAGRMSSSSVGRVLVACILFNLFSIRWT